MNPETISINSLDLDKIFDYCKIKKDDETSTKKNNEIRQQEISNSYQLNQDGEFILTEKIVHEVVSPQEELVYDDVKLDFIKSLLFSMLNDTDDEIGYNKNSLLILQTFLNYGFLKTNQITDNA